MKKDPKIFLVKEIVTNQLNNSGLTYSRVV